jgi:hypothetical protein
MRIARAGFFRSGNISRVLTGDAKLARLKKFHAKKVFFELKLSPFTPI